MATDPPFSFLFLKIGIEFILFDSGKFNPSSGLCIISGCATLPKFLKGLGEDRKRMTKWWVPTETGLLGKAWERKNQGELWGGHIGLSQLLDLWLIFPLFKKHEDVFLWRSQAVTPVKQTFLSDIWSTPALFPRCTLEHVYSSRCLRVFEPMCRMEGKLHHVQAHFCAANAIQSIILLCTLLTSQSVSENLPSFHRSFVFMQFTEQSFLWMSNSFNY